MEQLYTIEQVESHSTPDNAWVIFRGNVYDITKFIQLHPGGAILNKYLGKDVEKVWIDGEFSKHLNFNKNEKFQTKTNFFSNPLLIFGRN
jgi:cytochrome b involved in lipid metabolism